MPTRRSFVPDLFRLAWPVVLARLGIMGMGLVDVVVVGQLAPAELPHQALGWAPTAVFLVAGIGLLTGVQVLGARAIGERAPAKAGEAWRRGLIIAGSAGALSIAAMWLGGARLFTTFGVAQDLAAPSADVMRILTLSVPLHLSFIATSMFMESIQRPLPPTIVMWCANAINLALNLALVPEHGAIGSAWATFGARAFLAAGLILWVLMMKDGPHFGVRRAGKLLEPSYRALLWVGGAAAVSHGVEAGAFSAMTIIAGRLGADAVASYQILLNLLAIVFMIALGFSTATAVLTAEAVGRGAQGEAARASWTGLAMNTLCMAAAALILLLLSQPIARGYTADAALAAMVASLIPLTALVLAPDGAQVVVASALRARGDNWFPTASHILAYLVAMPSLAFWLAEVQGLAVAGLILAIFWASVLSAAVLLARMLFLTRRAATLPSPV